MRPSARRVALAALIAVLGLLAGVATAGAAVSHPYRGTLAPTGSLEGPCGAAVSSEGDVFVSDYYNHSIGEWNHVAGTYGTRFSSVSPLNGPCGLAVDSSLNLYVNYWHGEVVRYPSFGSPVSVVSGRATGVAVDRASGDLYVNHRTSIDVYEAPVEPDEAPSLQIGIGTLEDGYGLAVSPFAGTKGLVYVADAADGLVKVYDPEADPSQPLATIDGAGTAAGKFVSLVDASLAVDGTNGHLFVVDDVEPGFEHPHAAISEFNADGIYRGQLDKMLVHGEPTGIAVNESFTPRRGEVYVTSGNGSNVVLAGSDPNQASSLYAFGPAAPGSLLKVSLAGAGSGSVAGKSGGIACGEACEAEFDTGSVVVLTATPSPGSVFAGWSGACSGTESCQVTMNGAKSVEADFEPEPAAAALRFGAVGAAGEEAAVGPVEGTRNLKTRPQSKRPSRHAATATQSEIVQRGGVRVAFDGDLTPKALPRARPAPVRVEVGAKIAAASSKKLPQLRQMTIAINRYGRLDAKGLPVCRFDQIQPATTADALSACRRSLVGEGSFTAKVLLEGQAPFPSAGKVYAYNGTYRGRPAILAHVYGTQPAPTSYTLPFVIARSGGTFGTILEASFPEVTADVGYVTGLSLKLSRNYSYRGHRHSYLSASCPAPKGFSSAVFPFAKASLAFSGGRNLGATVTRTCKVR